MAKNYTREKYTSEFDYYISRTKGQSAEESIIGYPCFLKSSFISYYVKSNSNTKVEGKRHFVEDGGILIVNSFEVFQTLIKKNALHDRISLHIKKDYLKHLPYSFSKFLYPFFNKEKGTNNYIPPDTVKKLGLDRLMLDIYNFKCSKKEGDEAIAFSKVLEFMISLSRYIQTTETSNVLSKENPIISQVLEYINEHFKEDISINDIAEHFFLDSSYLSHLFTENVGYSIWNYVIFRRISFFNHLLNEGKLIEPASRESGFKNYSNFFRLYKKYTGLTPSQYLKSLKNKAP